MSRPQTRLRTRLAEPEVIAPQPWTPPADALPPLFVHLTSHAPGCADLPLSDHGRWRCLSWLTPSALARTLLRRLRRRADQVALRVTGGDVEIHDGAGTPPPGCERLLAVVFDVPAQRLVQAFAELADPAERRAA